MDKRKRAIGMFIAAIVVIAVFGAMFTPASAVTGGIFWVSNDDDDGDGVIFSITLDKEITMPIGQTFGSPEALEIRTRSPAELFITETEEDRIWKYNTITGVLSLYADLSSFEIGDFSVDLESLALNDNGVLFATDNEDNETVWRMEDLNVDGDALDGGEVTRFINEISVKADTGYPLDDPESIVFASFSPGVFYIGDENETDMEDGIIFRVLPNGTANIYTTGTALLTLTGHDTAAEFEALEVNPFTGELYASDEYTIWALRDLNNDGDAMDNGEATFIANESTISADTGIDTDRIDIVGLAFDGTGALYVSSAIDGDEGYCYIFRLASNAEIFVGPDDFSDAGYTGVLELDDIVYQREQEQATALSPTGIIALISLLSAIATVAIVRKRR
jgi:hypothetical protein